DGERNEGETGRERPHPEYALEVQRAKQEEPEDRAGGSQHEHEPATDGPIGDALDAKERRVDVTFVDREGCEAGEPAKAAKVRLNRSPACRVRPRDPIDDCSEARGRESCAGEVD